MRIPPSGTSTWRSPEPALSGVERLNTEKKTSDRRIPIAQINSSFPVSPIVGTYSSDQRVDVGVDVRACRPFPGSGT